MLPNKLAHTVTDIPGLSENGMKLSRAVHTAVLNGGYPVRKVVDWLHGTWLGHPLHPVLTDLTIGAWSLGALFDVIAAAKGDRYAERAADTLVSAGTITSIATVLTGLADFSTVKRPAIGTATLHALLNDVNVALYLISLRDRRKGNRRRGVFFSSLALVLTAASAWLGGHLVYSHKVGVDHSQRIDGPEEWQSVLDASSLPESQPKTVEVDGNRILIYRCNGTIHAVDAVCSHAGGPLEEGKFSDCTVQCPWHDSVFDLRTGGVVHGPATQPVSSLEARVQEGQVQIRIKHPA